MVIVQEEADPVYDQTESHWRSNKICADQTDLGRTRAGQLQPRRNYPRQRIPSKLHKVHQCSNPRSFLSERPPRPEKVDETLSEKKTRDMLVQDYIARVIKINNYLKEFLSVIVGRNATKLPDNKQLDLLEFGIPIKWQ